MASESYEQLLQTVDEELELENALKPNAADDERKDDYNYDNNYENNYDNNYDDNNNDDDDGGGNNNGKIDGNNSGDRNNNDEYLSAIAMSEKLEDSEKNDNISHRNNNDDDGKPKSNSRIDHGDEDDNKDDDCIITRNGSRISNQGFNSKTEIVTVDDSDDINHSDNKNGETMIMLGERNKDDDDYDDDNNNDGGANNDDGDEAGYKEYLVSKDQLVQHYHKASAEFHEKQELNLLLQRKLVDHYKKKKGSFDDDTQQQHLQQNNINKDDDVSQMDIDKQYLHKLDEYKKKMDEYARTTERHKNELNDYSDICRKITLRDFEELLKFAEFKRQTCSQLLQHKKELIKEIERKLTVENDKDREIKQLRLEYYKLLYKVMKRNKLVKDSEKLSGGLRILDFEQLKIENQTYKEKIEERNEDLQKLNDKKTKSIIILTHCNEKSFHIESNLKIKTEDLHSIEKNIALIRDELTHLKMARDNLRKENSGLKSGLGLLGNKRLIRDFQGCAEKNESLNADLVALKIQYNDLLARMKTVC